MDRKGFGARQGRFVLSNRNGQACVEDKTGDFGHDAAQAAIMIIKPRSRQAMVVRNGRL
jgi:hypothetical protein